MAAVKSPILPLPIVCLILSIGLTTFVSASYRTPAFKLKAIALGCNYQSAAIDALAISTKIFSDSQQRLLI